MVVALPPGLVWLASYPKSGNTWMRILLSNLRGDKGKPVDINNLSDADYLFGRWRFADDLLVDADLLGWQELERLRPLHYDFVAERLDVPLICKTHDCFESRSGTPVLGTRARAALYLVRDPRDVAVSLVHQMGRSLDEVIALMTDRRQHAGSGIHVRYLLGDWAGHVSGWTGQSLIPTKVVRYEDMRQDTVATLQGVITFLGGSATDEDIRRAVDHSTLQELQRQEAASGFREAQPRQKRFFRSGRSGEWREVLNSAQIRTIESAFSSVMTCWGYAPEG